MSKKRSYDIIKIGVKRYFWRDLYFTILRSKWWVFFLFIFLLYLFANSIFATFYYTIPGSLAGNAGESFFSSFLFSVQTLSTVGYGHLRPGNNLGHIIMVIECIVGVIFVAMVTGITFAKFSRPQAKILFSNKLLRTEFEGLDVLMFRVGNLRANRVLGASVDLTVVVPKSNGVNNTMRRLYSVKPLRSHTPIFELSWTVIIPIDDNDELRLALEQGPSELSLVVNIKGHDTDFSSHLSDSYIYESEDIVSGSGFVNILTEYTAHRRELDYTKFHDILS